MAMYLKSDYPGVPLLQTDLREKERVQHQRNFGLDLFRCLAINMVLWSHVVNFYYDKLNPFIANNIMLAAHWGVQLFFVLSGFLIGGILLKEVTQKKFNSKSLINFWKRRWLRTLPNYYLFLIIFIIIYLVLPE